MSQELLPHGEHNVTVHQGDLLPATLPGGVFSLQLEMTRVRGDAASTTVDMRRISVVDGEIQTAALQAVAGPEVFGQMLAQVQHMQQAMWQPLLWCWMPWLSVLQPPSQRD